jgi:hypothetical protein
VQDNGIKKKMYTLLKNEHHKPNICLIFVFEVARFQPNGFLVKDRYLMKTKDRNAGKEEAKLIMIFHLLTNDGLI